MWCLMVLPASYLFPQTLRSCYHKSAWHSGFAHTEQNSVTGAHWSSGLELHGLGLAGLSLLSSSIAPIQWFVCMRADSLHSVEERLPVGQCSVHGSKISGVFSCNSSSRHLLRPWAPPMDPPVGTSMRMAHEGSLNWILLRRDQSCVCAVGLGFWSHRIVDLVCSEVVQQQGVRSLNKQVV